MTSHRAHALVPTPLASVQGTLALELGPRTAPPPLPDLITLPDAGPEAGSDGASGENSPESRRDLERWAHRFVQAAVEIVGGDRPATQLLRWTSSEVYADLQRRAVLVARAAGRVDAQHGPWHSQPVRPQVMTVHATFLALHVAEASARVRYGVRSRAVALRFELRRDRWVCHALEFA